MFDIVDHVCDLPYYVIDTVLLYLPYAHVSVLVDSSDAALLQLACRRQWQRVMVSEFAGKERSSYRMSSTAFHEMVRSGSPPLYSIRFLDYRAHGSIEHGFMSDQWREYIARHTKTLGLYLYLDDTTRMEWALTASHMHTLNLTSLELYCSVRDSVFVRSMMASIGSFSLLRRLFLRINNSPIDLWSELSIPERVQDLMVYIDSDADPFNPRDVSTQFNLRILISSEVDVWSYQRLFPRGLERLTMFYRNRPVAMSHRAVEQFPDLQHNLVVYSTVNVGELEGARYGHGRAFLIDASLPANYSTVELPSGLKLSIKSAIPSRYHTFPVRCANHWIAKARTLTLTLPLDLTGVVIPPSVKVTVDGGDQEVPREAWDCFDRKLLAMRWTAPALPPQLAQWKHLRKLTLAWANAGQDPTFPTLEVLEELELNLMECAACPDLTRLEQCTRLAIKTSQSAPMNYCLSLLPERLENLMLRSGKLMAPPANAVGSSFDRFTRLMSLVLMDLRDSCLPLHRFPETLVRLRFRNVCRCLVNEVTLPPRLERLKLESCKLTDPWTVAAKLSSRWKLLLKQRTLRVFPETLRVLDFSGNKGLVPPPSDFRYPPKLVSLDMAWCGITDVAKYRLPGTLLSLCITARALDISQDFDWSRLRTLRFWVVDKNGKPMRTYYNIEILRAKMPGVEITNV